MNQEAWKREIEQALAQVKLKHQPAFSTLYDMTSDKLFGLIFKMVRDEGLAADILQEVYCKIWTSADQYRADLGSAWSWLCQVARNQAIDRVRQKVRLNETNEVAEEDIGADVSELWPESVDLGRCIKGIREEQQAVIISSYVYGLSHAELAEKFKAPLGTLKSWIRRGLKELKECLEA